MAGSASRLTVPSMASMHELRTQIATTRRPGREASASPSESTDSPITPRLLRVSVPCCSPDRPDRSSDV